MPQLCYRGFASLDAIHAAFSPPLTLVVAALFVILMFHLQIPEFRQFVKQYVLVHGGDQVTPGGPLLPELDDALSSLGSLHQIDVIVTASITASVKHGQPLKLSIIADPELPKAQQDLVSRISVWGVMAGGRRPDGDRTLQPLFIEIEAAETVPLNARVKGMLNMLLSGRSIARLAPQVIDDLPLAA